MPCDSIRTMTVEFHIQNMDLTKQAIAALGWTLLSERNGVLRFRTQNWTEVTIANGRANLPAGQEGLLDQLKIGVSQQIVKKVAAKYGWRQKQDTRNPLKGQLVKG